MLPLVLLSLALASALISRFLLIKAAFAISPWWGLGVLLPFGPTIFRLSFPDQARNAWRFGVATLALFFFYILSSPQLGLKTRTGFFGKGSWFHWAGTTKVGHNIFDPSKPVDLSAPKPAPTPSLEERREKNSRELADLRAWNERLHLKKRDLLHSDSEGNRMYAIEVDSYNAALAKASADRAALARAKSGVNPP
jgi:hypothetical protein